MADLLQMKAADLVRQEDDPNTPHRGLPSQGGPLDPHLPLKWLGLLIILLIAWTLRFRNPVYSTAFLDEASEILLGRSFLANPLSVPYEQTLYWHYGWFLWPSMAAIADRLGGLAAVRQLTALLGVFTVFGMYGFAARLFSRPVGLASAAVFALLGPAIVTSRMATYDAAALCFLVFGLWLYLKAWQEHSNIAWFSAALCFFASFLSKYIVALYFPFLVVIALRKGKEPFLWFTLPLTAFCATYGFSFLRVLQNVFFLVSQENKGFHATPEQLWMIYGPARIDFWILILLSLLVLLPLNGLPDKAAKINRRDLLCRAVLLWLGMCVLLGLQFKSSAADLRFFKHSTYSMVFITPLAMEGLLRVLRRGGGGRFPLFGAVGVALVAIPLGWSGNAFRPERMVFWANLDPIVCFFDGRLSSQSRLLVNDFALPYYFDPPVKVADIVGPYFFAYGGLQGEKAYAAAVRDGFFDWVVFAGEGMGSSLIAMHDSVKAVVLQRYALRLKMPDPVLGAPIEIYERINPPIPKQEKTGPRVEVLSPTSSEVVRVEGDAATLRGRTIGVQAGAYVRIEVLTNRWYPQGDKIFPGADGLFSQRIFLGAQCNHIIRARLFDERGKQIAAASNFGIARANPDGTAPACP